MESGGASKRNSESADNSAVWATDSVPVAAAGPIERTFDSTTGASTRSTSSATDHEQQRVESDSAQQRRPLIWAGVGATAALLIGVAVWPSSNPEPASGAAPSPTSELSSLPPAGDEPDEPDTAGADSSETVDEEAPPPSLLDEQPAEGAESSGSEVLVRECDDALACEFVLIDVQAGGRQVINVDVELVPDVNRVQLAPNRTALSVSRFGSRGVEESRSRDQHHRPRRWR
ncbi:MAG: hypothetical protein AB8G14_15910 [Ilumatobacter sp.]